MGSPFSEGSFLLLKYIWTEIFIMGRDEDLHSGQKMSCIHQNIYLVTSSILRKHYAGCASVSHGPEGSISARGLPADLSFFSTLGFSFWLMKPHVSIILPASVRGCPLQPPPYISLLWSLTETCHTIKPEENSISFFDLHPHDLMRRASLHFMTLQTNLLWV